MKAHLALLCIAIASAVAATESITRETLEKGFFQSIGMKPGEPPQLLLRFKSTGSRFLCLRNGSEEKVNDYGETMAVKPGETFSVSEHHAGLEFRPLPSPLDKNGWLMESEFDARSFGGALTTRYGIVLLVKKGGTTELQFIPPQEPFDPKLPPTDPTYQSILKIIAENEPLLRHELNAETATGPTRPPFPTGATAVTLHWQTPPSGNTAPLEVRWIAAAVNGVEKGHLIASGKSDAGKMEGVFTLKKPTAGFPPGRYRVEIWQGGKEIYRQEFEIRR